MVSVELVGVPFDGYGREGHQAGAAEALRDAGLMAALAGDQLVECEELVLPAGTPYRGPDTTLINEPPSHLCVVMESRGERVLLLGDAITSPVQLEEPGWHSLGDVDLVLAEQSRLWLCRWFADRRTIGVGAHFPELQPGNLATTRWNPSLSR